MKVFITLSICAMNMFQPAAGQTNDRLTGLFINTEAGLSVSITKEGDQYHGYFEYQKQRYPFKGVKRLGILDAEYDFNGAKIPFTLSYLFGAYYVTSEGVNIQMERKPGQVKKESSPQLKQNLPEQITPGVQPLTGKRMSDRYGGYSFQLPAGWSAREDQGSLSVSAKTEAAGFSVSPHNYSTKDEILQELTDVVDESSDTYMRRTATEHLKNGVFVRLEGRANGKPVIVETIAIFSPYGGGVSLSLGAQPPDYSVKLSGLLRSMAATVQFSKPQISAAAREWTNKLTGKQLIYLSTSGGGSEKITINLYTDGSFTHSNNSTYLSGGSSIFSYAGKASDKGKWKIQSRSSQILLLLFAEDGSTREYAITTRSATGEISLNGRRYFLRSLH